MIKVYTIPDCFYCKKAKELLTEYSYNFSEINLTREEYVTKINNFITLEQRNNVIIKKAPQILIGETLIGGYTDLKEYIESLELSGTLQKKLKNNEISFDEEF